eukprot:437009_1
MQDNTTVIFKQKINSLLTNENVFDSSKKDLLYCWIELRDVVDATKFIFSFYLYVDYDGNTYCDHFKASFDQIKRVHSIANSQKEKYFPTKFIPSEIKNLIQFDTDQLNVMEQYILLNEEIQIQIPIESKYDDQPVEYEVHKCIGPQKYWWETKRTATNRDITALCVILRQLFNSPIFVNEPYLYTTIVMKSISQSLLQKSSRKWRRMIHNLRRNREFTNKSHKYYANKVDKLEIDDHLQFHSIVALLNVGHTNNPIYEHWSLLFIGFDYCLEINWWLDPQSSVHIQLFENDCVHHRALWYKYRKQFYIKNDILGVKTLQNQTVTVSDIDKAIRLWLEHYPKYEYFTNNSHYFVRDIVAAFDRQLAHKLHQSFGYVYKMIMDTVRFDTIQKIYKQQFTNSIFITKTLIILICIEHYFGENEKTKAPNLPGTQIDKRNVVNVFNRKYNYDVICNKNKSCSLADVEFILKTGREIFDNNDYDCVMFIYSGHATATDLLMSDCREIGIYKKHYQYRKIKRVQIESYFDGYQAKNKMSACKFYFIDACRGTGYSLPCKGFGGNTHSVHDQEDKKDTLPISSFNMDNKIHPDENRCIFYPNTERFIAYDDKHGGILINGLCETFKSNISTNNFLDIQDLIREKSDGIVKVKTDDGQTHIQIAKIEIVSTMSNTLMRQIHFGENIKNVDQHKKHTQTIADYNASMSSKNILFV